jgi:cytochrome c2
MQSFRFLLIGCALLLVSCGAPKTQTPFNTPLTMRELMEWVIDPAADGVWESVAWISNSEGDKEIFPTTQAQWDVVRNSAATLVEAANLLMLDTRAVDKTNWMQAARRLSKTAEIALKAAKDKDVQLVFDIGAEIYNACSSCHRQYADFYKSSQLWPSLTVVADRSATMRAVIQAGLKEKRLGGTFSLDNQGLQVVAHALAP